MRDPRDLDDGDEAFRLEVERWEPDTRGTVALAGVACPSVPS